MQFYGEMTEDGRDIHNQKDERSYGEVNALVQRIQEEKKEDRNFGSFVVVREVYSHYKVYI